MTTIKPSQLPKIFNYYRNCYREDSRDLSISNVGKVGKDRCILIKEEDGVACGAFHRFPIVDSQAENMRVQAEIYRKERLLIYGCLMIGGRLESSSGFSQYRSINSPLIYFPASLEKDDDLFVRINTNELRINVALLRQLLKPDANTDVMETFPEVSWPLNAQAVMRVTTWLQEFTDIQNTEKLLHWPRLVETTEKKTDDISIYSACCLVLAECSRGSRGVLHELGELETASRYSPAIQSLFFQHTESVSTSAIQPNKLPRILSVAQIEALKNSAQSPLSLISGPPGTGKSFTIAAIATDHLLRGEAVLIVSKSKQAVDVITDKLKQDFGLNSGFVHAGEQNFLATIRNYLDELLKQGVGSQNSIMELQDALMHREKQLTEKEEKFQRILWIAKHADRCAPLFKRISAKLQLAWHDINELWSLQDEIGKLQDAFEQSACDYINAYRTETLNQALQKDRTELVKFHKGLRSRTSKTLEERFSAINFAAILKTFPIWLVTVNELNRVLPLTSELFDLVIVDEATQCDIASTLPAMQRAKRAVIVGDRKQLKHVSFLSRQKQRALWKQADLPDNLDEDYSYRDLSLLDITSDALPTQEAVTLLDEHYRSKPELIAFSNEQFYASRLKIMQARPSIVNEHALLFVKVNGSRTASGRNSVEKDAILNKLQELIHASEGIAVKPSIGILSPYREQTEFLERCIRKSINLDDQLAHNILISTPYGFQGEERDIMLLSFAIDDLSMRAASYLNREDMFNVAITRAKQQQIVFYSVDYKKLSQDNLFKRYLDVRANQTKSNSATDIRCQFAKRLCELLTSTGAKVWIGYEVAGQELDLLCLLEGIFIGIDLIGGTGEFEESFTLATYKTLHRAGIEVIPLPYFLWKKDQGKCVEIILQAIKHQKGLSRP